MSARWGRSRRYKYKNEFDLYCYVGWPRRPQSHHTCRETQRTLQPPERGSALPISTLVPTFLTSCRLLVGTDRPAEPAHPQQPHSARAPAASRPGTAPGPAAGPFSTLPTPPLHLNPLGLGPGPPPPQLCPRGRDAATSWSKKRPIAAEKASPPDVPSGANRATDSVHLQHSNTEVNNHS